jgi:hypothetical protein
MSVRAMLARVQRLEQARRPPLSPFEQAFGSLEAWEADVQAGIDAGRLDRIDMPVVIACVRRWHTDGVWSMWRRDRVWEFGG